jgi:hypothetical protein
MDVPPTESRATDQESGLFANLPPSSTSFGLPATDWRVDLRAFTYTIAYGVRAGLICF